MVKDILSDAESKMTKTVESFERDLSSMRAGRAHPGLLEKIPVDYYGAMTPIQHLAAISVPESRMLVVQPFDPSVMSAIEKAIIKADIGVSVRSDGPMLRVSVPALTEERRKDLVKQLRRLLEEEKVAIRNIRRDALESLKAEQKDHTITEDDERRGQTEVQKLTDRFIKELDVLAEHREKDILTP
ncbi:MAG: ribosome recycling factor [Sulfobacillus thermosulfidooxidans]|uniref:Ribosome-recycling factor n=1 Tax=Sulfobacillus thermotolerans TaxID=338644 RepID=A0ABN5GZE9_9FIRM|nr:ribosome recycling factor [Sulfobacillus sp. hq2]AUW93691.1 ribosome recycling factor [Sulfobacillus thermotolerans]MCY0907220.1 ribosome recycling factor [Sulfobacillus thermotolerans]POB10936.1 ribosome recycling factor [Sulfobacillus sp. hq2]PSR37466.1 MAG: ribosome recycling factor [Sulfobacillus thermosulfidooxidans]